MDKEISETHPEIPSTYPDKNLIQEHQQDEGLKSDSSASSLLLKLTSLTPHNAPNVRITREKSVWQFGRASKCDVVLSGKKVSGLHFIIFEAENASQPATQEQTPIMILEDRSQNGVYINDRRIPKIGTRFGRSILAHGDEISILTPRSENEIRFVVTLPSGGKSFKNEMEGIFEKYDLREQLGHGAFAVVQRCIEKSSGRSFAVKNIDKKKVAKNPKLSYHVHREIEILRNVNHPNVVQYVDFFEGTSNMWIVMEYIKGGDMMEYILNNGPLTEKLARPLVLEIVDAMEYLHSLGIAHRDLKPDNILLDWRGNELHAKISDFGLAKVVSPGTVLKTFCGTMNYLAPEVFMGGGRAAYSQNVDRWSLGVIVYVALSGLSPFDGTSQEQLSKNILNVRITYEPLIQMGISSLAIDFMRRLIIKEPELRMDEYEASHHPWLTESSSKFSEDGSSQEPKLKSESQRARYNVEIGLEEQNTPLSQPTTDNFITIRKEEASDSSLDSDAISVLSDSSFASGLDEQSTTHIPEEMVTLLNQEENASVLDEKCTDINPPLAVLPKKKTLVENTNIAINSHTTNTMDIDHKPQVENQECDSTSPSWCVLRTLPDSLSCSDIEIRKKSVVIGREAGCDIVIGDIRISKRHCVIWSMKSENGELRAMIKGTSVNNIFVRGEKLKNGRTMVLEDGWTLHLFKDRTQSLGFRVRLNFQRPDDLLENDIAATQRLHISPLKRIAQFPDSIMGSASKRIRPVLFARLMSLNSDYPNAAMTSPMIMMGRYPEIQGPLSFKDRRISSRHCRIFRDPVSGHFKLQDTSLNGTFVNGKLFSSMEEVVLHDKDEIVLLYKQEKGENDQAWGDEDRAQTRIDMDGIATVDKFGREVLIGYIWMLA